MNNHIQPIMQLALAPFTPKDTTMRLKSHYDLDDYDDELADLKVEAQFRRRRHNLLMQHPDCRDPDHPGCEQCREEGSDE